MSHFTRANLPAIAIVVVLFLIAGAFQVMRIHSIVQDTTAAQTPAPLQSCLINACKAMRAQERAACESSGNPASCRSRISSSVSANTCNPSQYPPTSSTEATAIRTSYTSAIAQCHTLH